MTPVAASTVKRRYRGNAPMKVIASPQNPLSPGKPSEAMKAKPMKAL